MADELQTQIDDVSEPLQLLPKQKRFAQEYVHDLNGGAAAIRAGYSSAGASVTANRLLNEPNVAAYIEKLKEQRAASVNVTAEKVLREMDLLATSSLEHYYVDDDGQVRPTPDAPEGAMRAIESITKKTTIRVGKAKEGQEPDISKTYEVKIKLWDKPTPLKLIGRHIGLFPNRVEVSGKDGKPIEVTAVERTIVDPKVFDETGESK